MQFHLILKSILSLLSTNKYKTMFSCIFLFEYEDGKIAL